jgi:hypothetical protein
MKELPAPVSGVEQVPDGEDAQIQEIADLMVKLLEQRYLSKPPFLRGVHPKAHGCAKATFTIRAISRKTFGSVSLQILAHRTKP